MSRKENRADVNDNKNFPDTSIRKGYNTDRMTDEAGGVDTYSQFNAMAKDTSDRTGTKVLSEPSLGRQVRSQGDQRGFTKMPPTDPDND